MYGKIFASMYDGSIYGKWKAIVTFQQMIALADKDGVVDMTAEALAARTSIPLDIISEGIETLEAPDQVSRTPDEEGRRIVRLDADRPWGWRITNYQKYREIRTAEERREYHRQYYHKKRKKTQQSSTISTKTQPTQPIVEAEVEVEAKDQNTLVETLVSTCPIQKIIDLYHSCLPELPKVMKRTKTRDGYIKQRWREDMGKLENWENFFAHVRQSDFLMGKVQGSNGKPPFIADLEWLTKPANFAKIAEGKYVR